MRPRFELIKIRTKLSTTNHPYPVVLTALDSTYEHAFPHSLLQMCLSSLLQFRFGINSGLMFTIIFLRHHGTNELVIFQNNPNNWDIMLYLSHIDESSRVLHALYSAFVGLLYLRRETVASTVQYCTNIHISGGGINCTINIFRAQAEFQLCSSVTTGGVNVQTENSMQCRLPYHKVKENFWTKEDWIGGEGDTSGTSSQQFAALPCEVTGRAQDSRMACVLCRVGWLVWSVCRTGMQFISPLDVRGDSSRQCCVQQS